MRYKIAAVSFLAVAALVAGCSGGKTTASPTGEASGESQKKTEAATFPVTVKHNAGETTIKAKPEKIVVMDMASLDTLDAMGVGDRVVGVMGKKVPTWLQDGEGIDYSKLPSVGATLFEPDLEAIAKLKPDLIVVGSRSAKTYPEVSKLAPTIDASVPWTGDAYSTLVPANIEMIGKAVGEEGAAKKAAEKITAAIKEYKDMGASLGNAMVLMSNAGEISMHGPKSRWAPIFDVFGFKPTFNESADEGHKGKKISFETVQEINPDWIFVIDRDKAVGGKGEHPAEQVLDNELVKSTNAAKNKRIVYLDAERWYIVMTGANNFLTELKEIAEAVKTAK